MNLPQSLRAFRNAVWLLAVAPLVIGCAAQAPVKPEDIVRQRAQARWDALLAGEWGRAYRYMSPSYRAVVEEKRYANQFGGGVAWVSAEVVNVTCGEDQCAVRMKVAYRIALRPGQVGENYFNETWIREDGTWWMYQKL